MEQRQVLIFLQHTFHQQQHLFRIDMRYTSYYRFDAGLSMIRRSEQEFFDHKQQTPDGCVVLSVSRIDTWRV